VHPGKGRTVRIHFQERPWDLYGSLLYTIAMAGLLLILDVGNLAAILLVLFVPGYVLVAALFPSGKEIDWIERVALSLGLSIAVVPLLGLLLNFTPFGIRFAPVVGTIALFTAGVGMAAWWRRMRLPTPERLSATVALSVPGWEGYGLLDKVLTVALAASIVVAVATLAYVIATPRPGERFTEFYILGPGGNASGYPTNLTVSQTGSVILGIANHEGGAANYTVRVDLVGVNVVFNTTAGYNQTVEVNRTTWTWMNRTVADGQNWTSPYSFSINATGLWKVQFLLYKDASFGTEYRELHLFVRVA